MGAYSGNTGLLADWFNGGLGQIWCHAAVYPALDVVTSSYVCGV